MHAANVLEFDALRSLVARYVRGALGARELSAMEPTSDRALISATLADTAEAIEYLRISSRPQPASRGAAIRVRFDDTADPGPALARLRIEGATLEATEIVELGRLLDLAAEIRSVLLAARENFPRLAVYATSIADLRGLRTICAARFFPTARWPIMPASRSRGCVAKWSGSAI